MFDESDLLWVLVITPIAWLASVGSRALRREDRRKWRRKADAQFFALQPPAAEARLRFSALSATIVLDEERYWTSEGGTHYELTRYARNEAGEHFMFVFNPEGKPFFKHVEPRIARVVLKERYQAPSEPGPAHADPLAGITGADRGSG